MLSHAPTQQRIWVLHWKALIQKSLALAPAARDGPGNGMNHLQALRQAVCSTARRSQPSVASLNFPL